MRSVRSQRTLHSNATRGKLVGQVALVTGAGRGIGRGVAEALAKEGAIVVLTARHRKEIEQVAHALRRQGKEAHCLIQDITVPHSIKRTTAQVLKRYQRIDILVTCAAEAPAVGPSETLPLREWERVMKADLTGTFLTCQSVGCAMLRQKYGRIINMTSFHAVATYPGRAAYAAAKAGVCGLTRVLALEWGNRGITINAIAPGPIRTPRTSWFLSQDPASEEAMISRTPNGRLGETSDVAALTIFLASRESRHMTGQTFVLDGGWTTSAWWGKYKPTSTSHPK